MGAKKAKRKKISKNSGLKIRKATLKDLPVIMSHLKKSRGYHNKIIAKSANRKFIEKLREDAAIRHRKFIKGHILSRNGVVFIAEKDGKVAGSLLAFVMKNIRIFKIAKLGYVSDLFVKREFRGGGIGKALLEKTLEWFRKKGLKFASLKVNSVNSKAHSFYLKEGFSDFKVEMRKKL